MKRDECDRCRIGPKATSTIVSGTDELEGATGSGTFLADPTGKITLRMTP